jgi:hypothetical protein
MSVDTFKPEVWAAALLGAMRKALVYGHLVNRDYEGQIRDSGDTVTVNSISRPTIGTYVPNVTKIVPEKLTTAQRKLIVDQAKYFAFEIDDVDKRQIAGELLPEALSEAGYGLADVFDRFIASLYTGVQAANALGTVAVKASEPTKFYDSVLVPLKVVLDEANVPTEGRWVVVPSWGHGRLLLDDRFIRADASGKDAASANGHVGEAAGFHIAMSNNTPAPEGDDNIVIAGTTGAISAAEQINDVEAYRPQDSFSDAVKGLELYGAKLMRPDGIATCQASQT